MIMTGEDLLSLSDSTIIENVNIFEAAKLFRKGASSWFTENNKCLLMLSLLDIIQNDKYINGYGSASFEKFIDKNSNVYYFSEFMIRILLYSAHNDIDETEEKDCVKRISKSINKYFKPNDKQKYSMDEPNILTSHIKKVKKKYIKGTHYSWDPKEQKLTILDNFIF